MRCNLKNRNQIIEDYLSARLPEAEREAFDEHCFNCDVCFRELRLREVMIETIKKDGAMIFSHQIVTQSTRPIDEKKSFLHKIFPNRARRPAIAFAVFVLLVAISGLVLKLQLHKIIEGQPQETAPLISEEQQPVRTKAGEITQKPVQTTRKPAARTTGPAKPGQLYAANFQPLPMFEEMLSSNLRAPTLNILSPHPGQKVENGKIRFEWQADEPGPFYLKILNNRGRDVVAIETEQHRVVVTQKLSPGLYYWKLETREELLFLGKFIVPIPG